MSGNAITFFLIALIAGVLGFGVIDGAIATVVKVLAVIFLIAAMASVADGRDFLLVPDPALLTRRPSVIARALLSGKGPAKRKLEREFRPILLTSTTGRSSEAVPFFYTQHDIDNLAVAGYRVMRVCGAEREMRMLNMFPFAPHLAFWITHYAGTEFGVFMLSSGGGGR